MSWPPAEDSVISFFGSFKSMQCVSANWSSPLSRTHEPRFWGLCVSAPMCQRVSLILLPLNTDANVPVPLLSTHTRHQLFGWLTKTPKNQLKYELTVADDSAKWFGNSYQRRGNCANMSWPPAEDSRPSFFGSFISIPMCHLKQEGSWPLPKAHEPRFLG